MTRKAKRRRIIVAVIENVIGAILVLGIIFFISWIAGLAFQVAGVG